MADNLETLHEIEWIVGELDMKTGDDILAYLDDDPTSRDPHYLIELFGLKRTPKYDGLQEGDIIRAYDHEPMEGRTDRYVEGIIRDIVRAGDADETQTIPFDAYRIRVTKDATFPNNPRTIVIVPMETTFDYEGRIKLIGSEDELAAEHAELQRTTGVL